MAKITPKYTIKINHDEAVALSKFLGDQSGADYENAGLTLDQAGLITELWVLLGDKIIGAERTT